MPQGGFPGISPAATALRQWQGDNMWKGMIPSMIPGLDLATAAIDPETSKSEVALEAGMEALGPIGDLLRTLPLAAGMKVFHGSDAPFDRPNLDRGGKTGQVYGPGTYTSTDLDTPSVFASYPDAHIYQYDIPDKDIDKYFEVYSPFDEQSKPVQDALRKMYPTKTPYEAASKYSDQLTGDPKISKEHQKKVMDYANAAGIRGNKTPPTGKHRSDQYFVEFDPGNLDMDARAPVKPSSPGKGKTFEQFVDKYQRGPIRDLGDVPKVPHSKKKSLIAKKLRERDPEVYRNRPKPLTDDEYVDAISRVKGITYRLSKTYDEMLAEAKALGEKELLSKVGQKGEMGEFVDQTRGYSWQKKKPAGLGDIDAP